MYPIAPRLGYPASGLQLECHATSTFGAGRRRARYLYTQRTPDLASMDSATKSREELADLVRQEIAATARLVVVKVGTRVLTDDVGRLDEQRVGSLAEELHELCSLGRQVVLVSSGAVGAGMGQLNLTTRPADLAHLQAVAAVGQSYLVQAYDRSFRKHGRHAAQVLLTAEDLDDRTRYLNVRNTIFRILEYGAIPIINENDTVAVAELQTTFGDNDRLAALVTNLLRASLLILLSDVDGLFDRDPDDSNAQVISLVPRLNESVFSLAMDRRTGLGKGGMLSKLNAAKIATSAGENVIIAGGRRPGVLRRIMNGDVVGTLFLARGASVKPRKRWIGLVAQPKGILVLDDGACAAIKSNGKSLLAIGVVRASGGFRKGDVVSLRNSSDEELARGLTNYHADEIERIKGCRTSEIAAILGHCPYCEVVHRDNLLLTG